MERINQEELENVTEITLLDTPFMMYGTMDCPLFLAIDIAHMIEYSEDKVGQMLELVDDDEKLTDTIYRSGQRREMWFLTEYGLYELLMQSRKPLAKKFKMGIKSLLHKIRIGEIRLNRIAIGKKKELIIDNARIIFCNFSGEESRYNRAGDRNFCVVIDSEEQAEQLIADGWNVKKREANERYSEPMYYLKVSVGFDNYPPKVTMVNGRVKTLLDEESIGELDSADLKCVDLTLSPYNWVANGNSGVKAYLRSMYAVIDRDPHAYKYEDEELPFN